MDYERYTVDDFLMDDLFLAYCQGSDPDAVNFWDRWQLENPPNLGAFREARQLFSLLSGQKPRLDHSLQELEILIRGEHQPTKVMPVPVARSRFNGWAVAASVLLISGLGWLGFDAWRNQYITYETAYNEQRTVDLPDGSVVTLNSHSILKHRRNAFSADERAVELEGEGFFTVRHLNTNAPFRVITNRAFDIQVLGTEFSVYNRPLLHRIVLNTGSVRVQFNDKRSALMLQPGQLVELNDRTQQIRKRSVRADQYNAWLRNQLVFDNTSLAEAIQIVEDQFGIRVRLDNADLAKRTITGILPINKPETVLDAIAGLTQLEVVKRGDSFYLSEKQNSN
jgi:transmembrane sensor